MTNLPVACTLSERELAERRAGLLSGPRGEFLAAEVDRANEAPPRRRRVQA